jgi:predicted CXXCH cytochrome family protein
MLVAGSLYLTAVMTTESVGSRTIFLPGATTDGHHQIEESCASCHTPFKGVSNDACLRCHTAELTAVDDSHPRSKFTDPRNADLLTRLDALTCTTCHVEHKPDMTRPLDVTLPDDYCFTCHADVGKDRPSHAGMTFESCASAGCHNYHDNTALYEDFLAKSGNSPEARERPRVASRALLPRLRRAGRAAATTSAAPPPADAPPTVRVEPERLRAWQNAVHARGGANCTSCHTSPAGSATNRGWTEKPGERQCAVCHDGEVTGVRAGKHGMRLAAGLTALRPVMARLPMKSTALDRELSCASCHSAHDFDTRRAAVTACLECHDDSHSRAYLTSPHYNLWQQEQTGTGAAGTGVSCATCHLPRIRSRADGGDIVFVQHNQNANLRPNEKMIRTVCLDCHGLRFSIDALADPKLVATNFTGRPARHVASVEMAMRRVRTTAH